MKSDPYSAFCRTVILPIWRQYSGSDYMKHLPYLLNSQYDNQELISVIQLKKIKTLINHAYYHTQFYKNHFNAHKLQPRDINTIQDLKNIPFLTKNDMRQFGDKMLSDNFDLYIKFLTSGSTGVPVAGYRDKACENWKKACVLRNQMWAGYRLGERIFCIYGNPAEKIPLKTKIRRKLITRESFLDSLNLTEKAMREFANEICNAPPSIMWGHTHNIYLFSHFLEKAGIDNVRVKGIFSAGMVMHEWERKKVEQVFKTKFLNRYGCEEIGLIASECEHQEGLHINTDDVIVEILDEKNMPCENGNIGQIVITDLSNFAMPIIRLKIGDMGRLTSKMCSCKRSQPMINTIEGRVADFLIGLDGRLISGISLTDHFGASIPGIRQVQIIQDKRDEVTVNLVKSSDFGELSFREIERLINRFFGKGMKFKCKFLENIPKENNGKYRFTKCTIPNPYYN